MEHYITRHYKGLSPNGREYPRNCEFYLKDGKITSTYFSTSTFKSWSEVESELMVSFPAGIELECEITHFINKNVKTIF